MIPGFVAHLWQSTLFVGAAWLLTLALRKNPAWARYSVWFIASAKFLIPFSLLVGLGTFVPWRAAAPPPETGWGAVAGQVHSLVTIPAVGAEVALTANGTNRAYFTSAALFLWFCGFAAISICWAARWKRIGELSRRATPLRMRKRIESAIPIMSAPGVVEPGVFGVFRPILLLPEGIGARLNEAQLEAILAHELCHVRRRDNLTAAIHMAVQAVFWFHPVVWWLGARLVDERERACDEEVLRGGCKAQVYAESILSICRLYLSSPLACISGVTGADLKRRIEAIMRTRNVVGLNLAKKTLLIGSAIAALVAPVIMGARSAPAFPSQDAPDWQTKAGGKMMFEVASVKQSTETQFAPPSMPFDAGERYQPTGGYFRADFPLWSYIQFAYKLWAPAEDQQREIARLPKWVTTDRYSVEARAPGKPTKDQFRLMVQSLLADRFKLAAHFETRDAPVSALTLVKAGKLGPKLIRHADGRPCGDPAAPIGPMPAGLAGGKDEAGPENYPPMCDSLVLIRWPNGTRLAGFRNATMDQLAGSLSPLISPGRTLVDRSGLSGRFDFTLDWASEPSAPSPTSASTTPPDTLGPTPQQALRDQLGLKLEAARAPVKILVIDRVERPSEN